MLINVNADDFNALCGVLFNGFDYLIILPNAQPLLNLGLRPCGIPDGFSALFLDRLLHDVGDLLLIDAHIKLKGGVLRALVELRATLAV